MTQAAKFLTPLALCAALLPQTSLAQQKDSGTFSLSIRGIPAGALSFSGSEDGKSYSANGRLESTGLIGALFKVRYDASANGRIAGGRFVPSSYSEKTSGARENEAVMNYKSGVPQVKKYAPPRPASEEGVDPATMGGTVDPMTAIYGTLRDVPRDQVCKFSTKMFDGKRASQIRLSNPQASGDGFRCNGEYRRLQGYSAKDMAEKQRFPFTLTYAKVGEDRFRVNEIALDTTYGAARLTRR